MLLRPNRLVKTAFIEQLTNTSTSSTSFVDLLTLTYFYDTNSSRIIYDFSACITTSAAVDGAKFRMVSDNSIFGNAGCTAAGGRNGASSPGYCAALCGFLPTHGAGSSSIKIQWCVATGGTASILPATGNGHACLFIAEIYLEDM